MLDKYLYEIKEEMQKLNIEECDDILEYFHEMINDRIENGESIEEIIKSLGTAKEIAANFISEETVKQNNEVSDELEHLQFNDIKDIDIDLISYNIEFGKSKDDNIVIEYDKRLLEQLNIKVKNKKLIVDQKQTENSLSSLFKIWQTSKTESQKSKIMFYIPDNYDGNLSLDSVSGKLDMSQVSFEKIKVDQVSGKVNINDIYCKKLNIEAVSGNIKIDDATVDGKLIIETVSGVIDVDRINCINISCETVSGNINIAILGLESQWSIRHSGLFKDHKIDSITGNGLLKISTVSGKATYRFIS